MFRAWCLRGDSIKFRKCYFGYPKNELDKLPIITTLMNYWDLWSRQTGYHLTLVFNSTKYEYS